MPRQFGNPQNQISYPLSHIPGSHPYTGHTKQSTTFCTAQQWETTWQLHPSMGVSGSWMPVPMQTQLARKLGGSCQGCAARCIGSTHQIVVCSTCTTFASTAEPPGSAEYSTRHCSGRLGASWSRPACTVLPSCSSTVNVFPSEEGATMTKGTSQFGSTKMSVETIIGEREWKCNRARLR